MFTFKRVYYQQYLAYQSYQIDPVLSKFTASLFSQIGWFTLQTWADSFLPFFVQVEEFKQRAQNVCAKSS